MLLSPLRSWLEYSGRNEGLISTNEDEGYDSTMIIKEVKAGIDDGDGIEDDTEPVRIIYGTHLHTGWDLDGRLSGYLPQCSWLPVPLTISQDELESAAREEEFPLLILTTPGKMVCWLTDGEEKVRGKSENDVADSEKRKEDFKGEGCCDKFEGSQGDLVQLGMTNICSAVRGSKEMVGRVLREPVVRK